MSQVQTRGRGRMGRVWRSPKGGLWLSIILRPRITPSDAVQLQFLAANACCRAIQKLSGIKVWTKWPNDIVLDSGKIAGILAETKTLQNDVDFAIVGIGINVNPSRRNLPPEAVSLYDYSARKYDLEMVQKSLLKCLAELYDRQWKPSEILSEWWRNCCHRGRRVVVSTDVEIVEGLNTGVGPAGQLIVQTAEGTRRSISEGTLRLSEC